MHVVLKNLRFVFREVKCWGHGVVLIFRLFRPDHFFENRNKSWAQTDLASGGKKYDPTDILHIISLVFLAGYPYNPYNGVVCNDTITATGVFSSRQLWRLSKGKKKIFLLLKRQKLCRTTSLVERRPRFWFVQ